ncbi:MULTISPECIES: hypothetical protein [unclassified Arthrobacter]|uniref:hypothetical protein n=1 Tax=unclassified Arthrobacter TaxID=235627 RepID=UPI001D155B6F|nr:MULTISPECIES: hypothetical protein [unclassified Arthrobacter]MCC3275407.1 hypothetical protein [Arthrobacter sp. zg-Y20]MCC9176853.1 hypothetical protein [Arthrobacter sp. zg-Y750]MDK1315566.1 hypothetical protein [Arthrobacter sp. zg.Y20]WIB05981.1 hypothetical protein QNO06_15905 [Arthrobacter sp. zg-Y20]
MSGSKPVTDLQEQIGSLILGDRGEAGALSEEEHLALVARAAAAERASQELQRRAVMAARGAGVSWAALGRELGMTRQAVQQRFGGHPDAAEPDARERWLGPVTAFDELRELELAGRLGWRTVGAELLRHRMLQTDTQWEHRRVLWTRPVHYYETDGWQLGCRAFPWLYLVRDLHIPPVGE